MSAMLELVAVQLLVHLLIELTVDFLNVIINELLYVFLEFLVVDRLNLLHLLFSLILDLLLIVFIVLLLFAFLILEFDVKVVYVEVLVELVLEVDVPESFDGLKIEVVVEMHVSNVLFELFNEVEEFVDQVVFIQPMDLYNLFVVALHFLKLHILRVFYFRLRVFHPLQQLEEQPGSIAQLLLQDPLDSRLEFPELPLLLLEQFNLLHQLVVLQNLPPPLFLFFLYLRYQVFQFPRPLELFSPDHVSQSDFAVQKVFAVLVCSQQINLLLLLDFALQLHPLLHKPFENILLDPLKFSD